MRRLLAIVGLLLLVGAEALAARDELSARVSRNVRAVLDRDHALLLAVTPHEGDAWTRLALRVTGSANNWRVIAELNRVGENLPTDREIRVPLSLARPELQRDALRALFPSDRLTSAGWVHQVVLGNPGEGESLWKIAEWFTGDGANYGAIRKANSSQRLSTRKGDTITIPAPLLAQTFRPAGGAHKVTEAEDDPIDREKANGGAKEIVLASNTVSSGALEYGTADGRPYAVYRLQKGEALYSSVAIRFTGRVYANDVNEVVNQLVAFNGIADVARIPAGYGVKIPMELLLPEYRPATDPRRLAQEEKKRDTTKVARRPRAKELRGVHIIIDPGHGGRDVGTVHDDLWESALVYDVACRLKALLEKSSKATVRLTTQSPESGYDIANDNSLVRRSDHVVLTSPKYDLEDPVVGVHLRWYLANAILSRAKSSEIPAEKVIFISLHADSLHPSLRGAMAYVPGERYVQGSFSKKEKVYLARKEVREQPTVTHTEEDALLAEALSTSFAETVIETFREKGLGVHPFKPVRDNVVRDGKEWVPAVIRFNKVPTRVLLEICNLGNEEDRRLARTKKYRQSVAVALRDAIVSYFENQERQPETKVAQKSAGKRSGK